MTPTPQGYSKLPQAESSNSIIPRPLPGNEVVISGMSGIFPNSKSVKEFMYNLYNEVDMVSAENNRWDFDHPDVPKYLGMINGIDKFDAQFFRVHFKQSVTLEPTCRKMLEHAYSAIFDAGINPNELRGKKVGVFVGASISESEKVVQYDTIQINGFGITGTNKSMFANRISYWLDAKGPSYAIDGACASSMLALEHAYRNIATGHCDYAVVGGCNLCLQPFIQLNMSRIGLLCKDGKTKCFDKHGDGYARAEAISVLFLQRAKEAKRIYCEVYHAKTFYSDHTKNYLPIRKSDILTRHLEQFYKDIDVSPQDVEYVEAYAPGIADADKAELQSISDVYCKNRETPLFVGSVKSNMGNSEPASGLCSVTKVCLAYEKGELPANLHYETPLDIEAVRNGKLKIVSNKTQFGRGFTAVNSFSYTGVNVHVLLKGHYKQKIAEAYHASIPYLVTVSGRQESCVSNLLKALSHNPIDSEAISLLHNIHKTNISGHTCRGYGVIERGENGKTLDLGQGIQFGSGTTRPLWFVYSGMGSQWASMGKELMKLPIFAESIERCRKVLAPKGIDLVNILINPDKSTYDNILNSFIGIAAVQIGLTDVLREIGIVPDNIIGHSVGELGCAYADGCFTAEEMILSAYSRGLVSVQTPFIKGSMAAIGIGYKAILPLLPKEIEVACHNSADSCTISGPADVMKIFVAELTDRGIFAKEVPCSNIAYHSRYIASAGPSLLKYLKKVILNPKQRSDKWLSTSVPQDKWNDDIAKYSSAEYHTNNLLNSVLFEETSKSIPANAVLIEIAPHGLLQAILKRSLPDSCVHVPLTRRGHSDPIKFLLEAIGKLYLNGFNAKLDVLYPKVDYLVSTGTSLLSQLVEWEHSETWTLATYNKKDRIKAASKKFFISVHDDDHKYLVDHIREELNVYPEADILVRVWETLGLLVGIPYDMLPVTFQNVQFHNEIICRQDVPLVMNVEIHKGSQRFEVTCDEVCIASGFIFSQKRFFHKLFDDVKEVYDKVKLTAEDIYRISQLRGYSYRKSFQTIRSSSVNFEKALLKWDNEWAPLIDSMIQLKAIKRNHNGVSIPHLIQKLTIDVKKHYLSDIIYHVDGTTCLGAVVYDVYSTIRCGGIDIVGLSFTDKPVPENKTDAIVVQRFSDDLMSGSYDIRTSLSINLQLVTNNTLGQTVKITEFVDKNPIGATVEDVVNKLPTTDVNYEVFEIQNDSNNELINERDILESNLIIVNNLLRNHKKMASTYKILQENQFVMSREAYNFNIECINTLFDIISVMKVKGEKFVLLKKSVANGNSLTYLSVSQNKEWIKEIPIEIQRGNSVVLVSSGLNNLGLLGITKALRKEYNGRISLLMIDDKSGPSFNPHNTLYKEQLDKNLSVNIMKKGQWGVYYYVPTAPSAGLRNMSLSSISPGDLDALTWVENVSSSTSHNEIQVHYSGVNLRDVVRADGKLGETDTTNENNYGMDFSGINKRGERVMGVVPGGAISSSVEADPELLWPVPEHWSLEDAATVPLAYLQAFYCLVVRTNLYPGAKVLVHGGAGALGQAVIAVALACNCTVFTTVNNARKKKLLLKLFPELNENHIGNSRDNSFEDMVLRQTNGQGFDIGVSCMNGLLQIANMRCAGLYATTLFVSHKDMEINAPMGMNFITLNRNLSSVCISSIFKPDYSHLKKLLQVAISDGITKGFVRPLTRVKYAAADVTKAFRLIAASKHCGRVLIELHDQSSTNIQSLPRLSETDQSCHVVVCQHQYIGVELADRLISRGVRKVMINIHHDYITGYLYKKILSWKKIGVSLKISSENLQTAESCVNLLQNAKEIGPIRGIYVTLPYKHMIADKMTSIKDLDIQFDGGKDTVVNLDVGSRQLCLDLKYFVVINTNSNDIFNSTIDDICHQRAESGLPALHLRYQASSELSINADNVVLGDVKPEKIFSILNTMEACIRSNYSVVVSHNVIRDTLNVSQKLARILGVNGLEEIHENLHLEQVVGIESINIDEIISVLKKEFNILYAKEKLEKLTIKEIKDLVRNCKNKNEQQDVYGLDAFVSYVDPDEYEATQPIMPMRTKLSTSSDLVEEISKDSTYLMLIPGYEGHHRIFHKVCERLKIQALTLQLEPDYLDDNVEQTAQRLFRTITKRFVIKNKFYLLGYSYGVMVALELAALLEEAGYAGTVFCLDSSPDVLKYHLQHYLGTLNETALQNSIIEHMYVLMNGDNVDKLREHIRHLESWEEKVEACVVMLRSAVNYSHQYKHSLIELVYRRINQAIGYKSNQKPLRSKLVLLKSPSYAKDLPKDYGLSKYSKEPVKVFDLELEHAKAPQDLRCSNIINCALDSDVLDEFKKNFTCDIYCADEENLF